MRRLLVLFMLLPRLALAQINADGVVAMGRNALYYEDYVLSIQYFNQVIEAKPYLYQPYYYRAVAKYYLGDYYGSINDCSASIERDPFIDDCFRLRAIGYVMVSDFEKASSDYRLLLGRSDENKDIWYNLVLCQTQLRAFEQADQLLDTMIIKWPRYAKCYMLKAQIALEQKDTIAADHLIDQTLAIDSFEVDALAGKAMLCMSKDSFRMAETLYDKAIIQSPRQAGFFLGRALARYQQLKLRGAMDDYNVALDISPDNYPGHYNRGLLRMQVGEDNQAIEDFDFVLKKEPHDRLALYNRALLLEKTGNYRAAIDDYTTVLADYPNFLAGYENRSRCYRKIGESMLALKDERKIVEAQLDEHFGGQKAQKRTTRKQKEQNIDEYQNLVVEDESDNIAKFYANDYRGRVQNNQVNLEPQPLYVLTFNVKGSDIIRRKEYAAFVDRLNTSKLFTRKLHITAREEAVNEDEIKQLNAENTRITEEVGQGRASVSQLFALAMISSAKRDYTTASALLDQALRQDSLYESALFLRSSVRSMQMDAERSTSAQSEEIGTSAMERIRLSYKPLIADLNKAIGIDADCSYLYYNRACLYQKMRLLTEALQDYSKAITLQPDLAEAYYNRGLIYVELSDYTNAYADFGKAGELGLYSAYSLMKHFRKQENMQKQRR